MDTVFLPGADGNILDFLNRNKQRVKLLAATEFVGRLYYLGRDDGQIPNFEFEVIPVSVAAFTRLQRENDKGGGEITYVVADSEGEGRRLKDLRDRFPKVHFAGLGCDLLPAALARSAGAIFSGTYPKNTARQLNLVFATPRSGSSLVSDVIQDLGGGDVREHLRDTLIEVFRSGYRFNRRLACRRFLALSSNNGQCGSKLITHFVEDYVRSGQGFDILDAFSSLNVKAIFLDRSDKMDQAVSSYLASRRGIWHVTSQEKAAELKQKAEVPYNFSNIYARYFSYRQQSSILDQMRDSFPHRLELNYEQDVAAGNIDGLAQKIAGYLGLEHSGQDLKVAQERKKIANDENERLKRHLEQDLKKIQVHV